MTMSMALMDNSLKMLVRLSTQLVKHIKVKSKMVESMVQAYLSHQAEIYILVNGKMMLHQEKEF